MELKLICPLNDPCKEALDFTTYLLANDSSRYDDQLAADVAKWAKDLQVKMKSSIFDHFHAISLTSFLSSFSCSSWNGTQTVFMKAQL